MLSFLVLLLGMTLLTRLVSGRDELPVTGHFGQNITYPVAIAWAGHRDCRRSAAQRSCPRGGGRRG